MKIKYKYLLVLSLLQFSLLSILAFFARNNPYFPFDLHFTHYVQSINLPVADKILVLISWPGFPPQVYILIVIMLLALFIFRFWTELKIQVFLTFAVGLVGYLFKYFVDRPRPDPNLVHVINPLLEGGKFSFPAGHVQSFTAILGFLVIIVVYRVKNRFIKYFQIILYSFLIATVGLSRIYSGEHWLSDVLGGYLLGGSLLSFGIWWFKNKTGKELI